MQSWFLKRAGASPASFHCNYRFGITYKNSQIGLFCKKAKQLFFLPSSRCRNRRARVARQAIHDIHIFRHFLAEISARQDDMLFICNISRLSIFKRQIAARLARSCLILFCSAGCAAHVEMSPFNPQLLNILCSAFLHPSLINPQTGGLFR